MHRHAFSNGAYPSQGGGTFSIQPHKYVPFPQCIAQPSSNMSLRTSYTSTTRKRMTLTFIVTADSNHDHNRPLDDGEH
jgi:hypothetical protein